MTRIITHRGLDPSRPGYFAESSREAFTDQLARGYGIEFDVLEHKGSYVVAHDPDLSRITKGGCHVISLSDLLTLIDEKQDARAISALHLKSRIQDIHTLDRLLKLLTLDPAKFIIFDVKVETATYLKSKNPNLRLVPSVAHPYDIRRYNDVVGGTLLSTEEALANRDLFYGVWLDEWDRADAGGRKKKLYTPEVFKTLHDAGLWIGLVTPELHASSPGLLGGEAHEDARDHETLMNRIREILALSPDAVCTDYPDEVRGLLV